MYICNDCKQEFDEPETDGEYMGEWFGFPSYQIIDVCPFCRSDDIEELNEEEKEEESENENERERN